MSAQQKAQNILNGLSRLEGDPLQTGLLDRYVEHYLRRHPEDRNLPPSELNKKALEFLRKVASGEIQIEEEDLLDKSTVNPELARYWEELMEKGELGPQSYQDLKKVLVRIKVAEKQKERLAERLEEEGIDNAPEVAEAIDDELERRARADYKITESQLSTIVRGVAKEANPLITEKGAQKVFEIVAETPKGKRVLSEAATTLRAESARRLPRAAFVSEKEKGAEVPETQPPVMKTIERAALYAALRARRPSIAKRVVGNFPFIGVFLVGPIKPPSEIEANIESWNRAINALASLDPARYSESSPIIGLLRAERNQILEQLLGKGEVLQELEFVPDTKEHLPRLEEKLGISKTRFFYLGLFPKERRIEVRPASVKEIQEKLPSLPTAPSASFFRFLRGLSPKRFLKNLFSGLGIKLRALLSHPWTQFFSGIGIGSLGFIFPPLSVVKAPLAALGGGISFAGGLRMPALRAAVGGFFRGGAAMFARGLLFLQANTLPLGALVVVAVLTAFLFPSIGTFLLKTTQFSQIAPLIHATSGALDDSEFIDVTKSATPTVYKEELPVTIEYKVTVIAKEKALRNISVSERFSVYQPEGNATAPPAPQVNFPRSLGAVEAATAAFSVELGPQFKDSIVTNTIVVTADVADGPQGESTTRSASVRLGDVPSGCFIFEGFWDEKDKNSELEAIGEVSRSSTYISKLCAVGPITLLRVSMKHPEGWGGQAPPGTSGLIKIFNQGLGHPNNTLYTLTHETGHIYSQRYGLSEFLAATRPGPFIRTYLVLFGFSNNEEDFAETIALYIVWKKMFSVNLPVEYPRHYNFAKSNLFGGFEY